MRRVGLLAVLGGMALAASAQAVVLVNPDGSPVGGKWQRWADRAKVATIHGPLTLIIGPDACGGAPGCSTGPVPPLGTTEVYETHIATNFAPTVERWALYFELGHQFDWHYLTARNRRYLARKWSAPHARWWDTAKGLSRGDEDGLEGVFAWIYADCAEGINDKGASIGGTPPVAPTINTCRFVSQLPN